MSSHAHRGPLNDVIGLGFGCSRFGSLVGGADQRTVEALVDLALDQGIRYFDTADIYGQGDSELFLGRALRRYPHQALVGTKIGQRFSALQRAFQPLKTPLKRLVGTIVGQTLSRARAKTLPRCYEPTYLARAVDASLRRLGQEVIDLVYLHSPSKAELQDGSAVDALSKLRTAGKIRLIGVSCDDLDAAQQALRDERVKVLQVPLFLLPPGEADLFRVARRKGIGIVVRGVMQSHSSAAGLSTEARLDNVHSALSRQDIDVVLVSTTKPAHLKEITSNVDPAAGRLRR